MIPMRIAQDLPVGSTVQAGDGTIYWKINPEWWDDETGDLGTQVTNQWLDANIGRHGGKVCSVQLGLRTQPAAGWDVEAGDYVVLSLDFRLRSMFHDEHDLPFCVAGSSQQLWRVAGWIYHAEDTSSLILDGPRDRMYMLNRLESDSYTVEPETTALEVLVFGEDVFQYVLPGQKHEKWSWDWEEYQLYEFVDPRPLVRS